MLLEKQLKDRDTLIEQSPCCEFSNTAVMHAQKLEIRQENPFMSRKIARK